MANWILAQAATKTMATDLFWRLKIWFCDLRFSEFRQRRTYGDFLDAGERDVSLDRIRYVQAMITDKCAASLPPTSDAFRQHVKRAQLQAAVWCNSHTALYQAPDPTVYGWEVKRDKLNLVYITQASAPAEVRNITHLYCSDHECTDPRKCHCFMNGLRWSTARSRAKTYFL